jgi:amidase
LRGSTRLEIVRLCAYAGGLPFGLEISGKPWHDGELLGYAYGHEQAAHHRHPPVLVERSLITSTP